MASITRNETGTGTIPNFTNYAGTFTTNTNNSAVLDYTGALTSAEVFGVNLGSDNGLYVYSPTLNQVRRVLGAYEGVTANVWSVLLESAFSAPLVVENVRVVLANLTDFAIANQGAADGLYDGVAFNVGAYWNEVDNPHRASTDTFAECKTFNATGTEFLIIEHR